MCVCVCVVCVCVCVTEYVCVRARLTDSLLSIFSSFRKNLSGCYH